MKKYNVGDIFEMNVDTFQYRRHRNCIGFVIIKRFSKKKKNKLVLHYVVKFIKKKGLDNTEWKFNEKENCLYGRYKFGEMLRKGEIRFLHPNEAAIFLLKQ